MDQAIPALADPLPSLRTWRRFGQRAGLRASLALGAALGGPIRAHGQRMDPVMSALIRFVNRMQRPGLPVEDPEGGHPHHHHLHALRAVREQYRMGLALTGLLPDPAAPPQPVPDLPGAPEHVPPGKARATVLFFHGGGFVMGSPATRAGLCARLARLACVRVINAPYRLAPEHPYPAGHDDAAAAWAWVRRNRPGPYVLAGDSAGANLAASLDAGEALLTLLIYPVLDMVEEETLYPSIGQFGEGYLLTAQGMKDCARMLLHRRADRTDPRLSPLRGDLRRAAPSVVATAGFDPLRDQGRAWADALQRAGRPAWLLEEDGLVHGYADFAGVVPAAKRAVDRVAAALRSRVREA